MPRKLQHTANFTQKKMSNRYEDDNELHHKHNKCHLTYRLHCPSHPSELPNKQEQKESAKALPERFPMGKLRKFRQRIAKGRFH